MATSTYMSFLMKGSEKLVDIKEFPDLGGKPEMLEITHMSTPQKLYIPGLEDVESMDFVANYDKDDFAKLKALEGQENTYAVWFGGTEDEDGTVTPTGSEGKFTWTGMLRVYVAGKGTNAVRDMNITISASTPIAFA